MADLLTTKNLSLEEQVRELQETVDHLVSFTYLSCFVLYVHRSKQESICDMDKGNCRKRTVGAQLAFV